MYGFYLSWPFILQKEIFWGKNILGHFLTQELWSFLKSARNCASFNFNQKIFQHLWGAVLIFQEDKRSNKIETVEYKKKHFYKLVLGCQGQIKITWSKAI